MLMIQRMPESGTQVGNCSVKYVYFMFIRPDFYIFNAPVSNRLIIKQGVSEYLGISNKVEHTIPFTSF